MEADEYYRNHLLILDILSAMGMRALESLYSEGVFQLLSQPS